MNAACISSRHYIKRTETEFPRSVLQVHVGPGMPKADGKCWSQHRHAHTRTHEPLDFIKIAMWVTWPSGILADVECNINVIPSMWAITERHQLNRHGVQLCRLASLAQGAISVRVTGDRISWVYTQDGRYPFNPVGGGKGIPRVISSTPMIYDTTIQMWRMRSGPSEIDFVQGVSKAVCSCFPPLHQFCSPLEKLLVSLFFKSTQGNDPVSIFQF